MSDTDVELALAASDDAAELALKYFRAGAQATIKSDGSPVTEADPAVEHLLHDRLGAARPDDGFLGEELGALAGTTNRTWVLDPIDGTANYATQSPNWSVHVALAVDGEIDTAVVTMPALGTQFWAQRGNGAFEGEWPRNGSARQLRVSDVADVRDARLDALPGTPRRMMPRKANVARPRRAAWCTGLIELARGEAEGFLAEGAQIWDHAPWALIVTEAGGSFTSRYDDPGLERFQGGGYYTNAALRTELLTKAGFPPQRI